MYSCSRTVPLTAKTQQTMTTTISNEVLHDIWIPHHDITDEHEEVDEVLQDIRIPHHDIMDEHEEDDDDNELHSSNTHPSSSSFLLSGSCTAASTVWMEFHNKDEYNIWLTLSPHI